MQKTPAETKRPTIASHSTTHTQEHAAGLPRHEQDEPRSIEVQRFPASDVNIEMGQTSFLETLRSLQEAQPAERATRYQPTQVQENTARLGVSTQPLESGTISSRCEPEQLTNVLDDRTAVKGSQLETLPPNQVSPRGFPSSHGPSSPQVPSNALTSTQFKIPGVPGRAAPANERTWRENSIASLASSQTLPANSVAYADKVLPNRRPLPTSPLSQVSPTRKRKVQHNVSDSGSEFVPSSDDEPLMNLVNRRRELVAKKAKRTSSTVLTKSVSGPPKSVLKP
jgi:hypothetical protein